MVPPTGWDREKRLGVCANSHSPRRGLLTFGHQGCLKFKFDARMTFLDTPKGKRTLAGFEADAEELRVEESSQDEALQVFYEDHS